MGAGGYGRGWRRRTPRRQMMSRHPRLSSVARRVAAAIFGLALCGLLWSPDARADQTSDEIKLGAQVAKEIETRYRLVTDPAMIERLSTVSEALARVVDRQDFPYHFKIVDIPGVNALGIPGGWVYVTKGMMKFIRTDHELAAVLAHELTHVAHRHYYIQQERQSRMLPALILSAALSVLAHSAVPLYGVSFATQGALANYQRDLEKEADLTGISFLTKTSYSPVAMLTLMEHLSQADKLTGQPDLGELYQDHPKPDERVAYIQQDLVRRGLPIVRRVAEGYLRLALDPSGPAGNLPVTIQVDGHPVLQLGATVAGQPPAERAAAVMDKLNRFFNTDPVPYDVRAVNLLGQWSVIGGQTHLFDVTAQDAVYAKMSPQALAEQFRGRLAETIASDRYNRKF
jgi:beta-barrel assembly-enhancing protease